MKDKDKATVIQLLGYKTKKDLSIDENLAQAGLDFCSDILETAMSRDKLTNDKFSHLLSMVFRFEAFTLQELANESKVPASRWRGWMKPGPLRDLPSPRMRRYFVLMAADLAFSKLNQI